MEITLNIDRSEVYREIEQSTSYAGAKMDNDESAYQRIRTTDDDRTQLQKFWDEARSEVAQSMIRILSSESMDGDRYLLTLNVSSAFDTALQESMQLSLFSYFVQSLLARWFVFTNKQEAGQYAEHAAALLDDVREKAFYKKRPNRPVY